MASYMLWANTQPGNALAMAKATKLTLEKKVKIIKLNIKGKNATRGYL